MYHLQSSTPNWLDTIPGTPGLCVKAVDRGDLLRAAKQANPETFTILRHWQEEQHFGGTFDENCVRARAFFETFIDETFRTQYAPYVDAIEELNEYLANSQNDSEIADRVNWAEACASVWLEEYRSRPEYAHIRLVLCNTAVGNLIHRDFAEIALDWDAILGYHPYTLWENGTRWDGDWDNLSGLFDTLEGMWGDLKPTWAFTEAGPFRNAIDGWRHGGCLGGDVNAYVAAVRAWIRDVKQTDAYREGRIVGFNLFTTGGGERWQYYETTADQMRPLAAMIREEWAPPDAPPPTPPPAEYYRVREGIGFLNLRTAPVVDPSTDIGDLHPGAGPLNVVGWDGKWALVQGWAHGDYIERVLEGSVVLDISAELPRHPVKVYSRRQLGAIDAHVVHHSATGRDCPPEAAARYHIDVKDWPGIGYHYWIAADGTIYQTQPLEAISAHVYGNNGHTIGTCVVGNFTQYAPTPAQVAALTWLHAEHIPLALGRNVPLRGHCEYVQTACPGDKWDWRAI